MGRQLYFTADERRLARNATSRNSKLRKAGRPAPPLLHHMATEQVVPPAVREAQQRRIEFIMRALASEQITPNQLILGDPVKSRSVSSSLSSTEIVAILGPL